MTLLRSSIASLFILFVATGCSSTTMTDRTHYHGEKLAKPARILVYDFTANPTEVPPESGFVAANAIAQNAPTPQELDLTAKLGAEIARQVTAQLRDAGLPAVQARGQPAPQVDDIMIRGYFVSAETGSAVKRMLIGFGSGSPELTTAVEGFQMTSRGPLLLGSGTFDSAGGKTPGMILPLAVMAATANPIGLIVGGTLKVAGEATGVTTIEGSAKRTADQISEQLIDAAKRQGWI
jgi:hypothetical protein